MVGRAALVPKKVTDSMRANISRMVRSARYAVVDGAKQMCGEGKRLRTLDRTADLAGMRSYRTLVGWKRAHEALLLALRATDAAYHPRARSLFDQIRRAAISIEANIVEG